MCHFLPGSVKIIHQGCQNPGRIVSTQQIHIAGRYLGRVILQNSHNRLPQAVSIVNAFEIIDDGGAERIVHHRIQCAIYKVPAADTVSLLIGSILPHLAQKQRIRANLTDPLFQHIHKFIGQLVRHIQAESVAALLQPVGHHRILAGDDIIYKSRVQLFHRGKGVEIPPAVIAVGIVIEGKPAMVRRIRGLVSANAGEGIFPVEIQTVRAGMGIHAVQDHLDAPAVGGIAHSAKFLHCSQHRVGGFIVAGIIAMGRKAFADGVQIQNSHAQRGDIVHFFRDSPEISAVKVVIEDSSVGGRPPIHFLVPVPVDGVRLQFSCQVTIPAAGKAVGKYLIYHCALGPIGGGKIRRRAGELPQAAGFHIGMVAVFKQTERAVRLVNYEVIKIQSRSFQGKCAGKYLIQTFFPGAGHCHDYSLAAVIRAEDTLSLNASHLSGNMDIKCAGLSHGQCAERLFKNPTFGIK